MYNTVASGNFGNTRDASIKLTPVRRYNYVNMGKDRLLLAKEFLQESMSKGNIDVIIYDTYIDIICNSSAHNDNKDLFEVLDNKETPYLLKCLIDVVRVTGGGKNLTTEKVRYHYVKDEKEIDLTIENYSIFEDRSLELNEKFKEETIHTTLETNQSKFINGELVIECGVVQDNLNMESYSVEDRLSLNVVDYILSRSKYNQEETA